MDSISIDFLTWSKIPAGTAEKNLRFGQWYCNKYHIQDSKLFYMVCPGEALAYIQAHEGSLV